jgi:SAM-dependent methyltransferase
MTVLDLSGGLGGGPRAVVDEFGVWVTGLERDREFAEAGLHLSTLAGMSKKADIGLYLADKLEIRAGSIDCVLCREVFHAVPDKARMLRVIGHGLKPRGQFVFTDFMLAGRDSGESPAIRSWLALEGDLELWMLDDYTRLLADEKLDVRVTEDITEEFRRMVIGAWANLTATTAGAVLTQELKDCLVTELDRWTHRIAAFDSGDLKVFRVYALKSASSKMLSDW